MLRNKYLRLRRLFSENAEAILVEPCSVDGLTTGLKEAHDAGIPVFVIHNNVGNRLGHISDSCRCKTRRGIEKWNRLLRIVEKMLKLRL